MKKQLLAVLATALWCSACSRVGTDEWSHVDYASVIRDNEAAKGVVKAKGSGNEACADEFGGCGESVSPGGGDKH